VKSTVTIERLKALRLTKLTVPGRLFQTLITLLEKFILPLLHLGLLKGGREEWGGIIIINIVIRIMIRAYSCVNHICVQGRLSSRTHVASSPIPPSPPFTTFPFPCIPSLPFAYLFLCPSRPILLSPSLYLGAFPA